MNSNFNKAEFDAALLYLLRTGEAVMMDIETKRLVDTDNMTDEYILEKIQDPTYGFMATVQA